MRQFLIALLFLVGPALPVMAQTAEIEGTISSQIEAFKADDFGRAFTFASPTIQGMFQTPENFGSMVRGGYPMVWRPAEVRYLDLSERGGRLYQTVQITDGDGRTHLLEYEMIELDTGWKINGVRLLEPPGVNA
ncbi:DUF4864 domain-containing protein [Seohaeicola nanhaiensis]|uniref:DUF4864 domain-containing protein n=1 Tax=Seohaeicola nanhaiensis TaxID=1387282 RepID=A0ABV9KHZ6_9RHOB